MQTLHTLGEWINLQNLLYSHFLIYRFLSLHESSKNNILFIEEQSSLLADTAKRHPSNADFTASSCI